MEKLQPKRINDYTTFNIPKDRPFRILQLTDLHMTVGLYTRKNNKLAERAIKLVVNEAKPDLIIITGDLIFPMPKNNFSINNKRMAKRVAELMNSFGIPWTLVFGNHDVEPVSFASKEDLTKLYSSYDNCLFEAGDPNISGMGNHIINLLSDDQIKMSLVMIDSNMYIKNKGFLAFFSGFDNIHDDQIEWYKREITKISDGKELVPSLAFFHIPPQEFKDAWKLHISGSDEVKFHFGEIGETNGYLGVPRKRGNFFNEMVDFKSLKGFFCGHDHLSNASITYKGIRMTYGMSIDYLAYTDIKKWSSQRGGTIIEVDNNGDFDIKHIKLDDLLEKENAN